MDSRQRERQKAAGSRPVRRMEKVSALLRSVQSRRPPDVLHPRRAQRQLLMDETAVKSAFALLSAKVTKEGLRPDTSRTTNVREGSSIMRRIRR